MKYDLWEKPQVKRTASKLYRPLTCGCDYSWHVTFWLNSVTMGSFQRCLVLCMRETTERKCGVSEWLFLKRTTSWALQHMDQRFDFGVVYWIDWLFNVGFVVGQTWYGCCCLAEKSQHLHSVWWWQGKPWPNSTLHFAQGYNALLLLVNVYWLSSLHAMQPHNSTARRDIVALCAPNVDTMTQWIAASRLVKVQRKRCHIVGWIGVELVSFSLGLVWRRTTRQCDISLQHLLRHKKAAHYITSQIAVSY